MTAHNHSKPTDLSNKTREGWQMEGASAQRRWHYIEGSTSLCGRFGFYMGEVGQALQPGNPGSDCAECVRRVARKIEKAKSVDPSPTAPESPTDQAGTTGTENQSRTEVEQ